MEEEQDESQEQGDLQSRRSTDGMLGCVIFSVTSNNLIGSFVLPHTLLMATPGCSTAPRPWWLRRPTLRQPERSAAQAGAVSARGQSAALSAATETVAGA